MGKNEIDYIWTDKKRTLFGLPLSFTRYFLTENKFITRVGLPLKQRIFGCGTIILYVRDTDTPIKEIKSVKAPRKVLEQLDKYINIQRDRYRTRGRDMIGYDVHDCDDHEDDYN